MRNITLMMMLVVVGITSGCTITPTVIDGFTLGSCEFKDKSAAPDWVCMPEHLLPEPGSYEYALGVSEDVGDYNFSYSIAINNARMSHARARGFSDGTLPIYSKMAEAYDSEGRLYVLLRWKKGKGL